MGDVQGAVRSLRAAPVLSGAAALSLALAIGATTAIFSVANGLLLRPLPVEEPGRLVSISSAFAIGRGFTAGLGWSHAMWERLRDHADAFGGALAWSALRIDLARGGEMEPAEALVVSGGFFRTLGVPAGLGRTLTEADDVRGGGPDGPVAVISDRLWQRRFARSPAVLGTPLSVDGVPVTIVGVTPPAFTGVEVGRPFDVALPLGVEPLIRGSRSALDSPNAFLLIVMLRLAPDQPLAAATAALQAMQPRILGAGRLPAWIAEPFVLVPAAQGTSGAMPGGGGLRQQYAAPVAAIFVVAALVLLIACVNIANLALARATGRRHEMSVRRALGAPGWRLARQHFVESLLLAAIGALAGLPLTVAGGRVLVSQLSTADPRVSLGAPLDWRVLAFTAVVTVATAVIFGTAPAVRAAGSSPISALKQHGPATRPGRSGALVAVQIALSLVLVVAAGLFVRTFAGLASTPLGFDGDRVLIARVNTARAHADAATRTAFHERLVAAAAAVPGVAHAGGSAITPLSDASRSPVLAEPGRVMRHAITPGWLAAYGTRVLAGRDVEARDTAGASPVVIVNDAYARKYFPERDPIGETVEGRTVIGVAADAVFGRAREGFRPTTYVPLAQSGGSGPPGHAEFSISVRPAAGSPAALTRAVAGALTAVHPGVSFTFRPLATDVRATLAEERTVAVVSGFFGATGMLLAGLGLYGIASYSVARRRTEIAIRIALGADRRGVLRLVLTRVAALVGAGVAVGLLASVWASRFAASLLYGLEPHDAPTYVGSTVLLTAVTGLAAWTAASRALRIDPAAVLRDHARFDG
jgi:predicted permease